MKMLDLLLTKLRVVKMLFQLNDVPARCRGNDEFVLGLTLPDQALTNDSYKKKNTNWKRNCPIVYTFNKILVTKERRII